MKHLVILAVILTVTLFALPVAAQEVGELTLTGAPTIEQPAPPAPIQAEEVVQPIPAETSTAIVPVPGPEGPQGPQGPGGPQGQPGTSGKNGTNGRNGITKTVHQNTTTTVLVNERGHKNLWAKMFAHDPEDGPNVASEGYVKDKIADHERREHQSLVATTTADPDKSGDNNKEKHQGGGIPWWLWPLLVLFAYAILLRLLWRRSAKGTLINTLEVWYGRHNLGTRQATVRYDPSQTRVTHEKMCRNLTTGGPYLTKVTDAVDNDIIHWRIRVQNIGCTPKRASEVIIADTLEGNGGYVKGSGRFYINNSDHPINCPAEVIDEIIAQLHAGRALRMSQIPNAPKELPTGSLYLVYDTEIGLTSDTGDSDTGHEFVVINWTPPAQTLTPAPPVPPTPAPPTETPAQIVERIRKEIIGERGWISDEFRKYLEGLGKEENIRHDLERYNQGRRILTQIDSDMNRRSDYPKANNLAANVVLGRMTADQAETDYRGATTEAPTGAAPGSTDEAKAGLLAGMKGGA